MKKVTLRVDFRRPEAEQPGEVSANLSAGVSSESRERRVHVLQSTKDFGRLLDNSEVIQQTEVVNNSKAVVFSTSCTV